MAFSRNVKRNVGVAWDRMNMDNLISPPDTIIRAQGNEVVYDSLNHPLTPKEHYYS